jgi:NAD(P)-dependent dehydrogenase (short-subunit alcohol dehydrogenase family)
LACEEAEEHTCRKRAVDEFGTIDILVNNAAHQATFKEIAEISDEEWQTMFAVNIHAMFYLTKAEVAHMKVGRLAPIAPARLASEISNRDDCRVPWRRRDVDPALRPIAEPLGCGVRCEEYGLFAG